jgi:hypothetical protein
MAYKDIMKSESNSDLKNSLKKRSDYHKTRQYGLSPFCSLGEGEGTDLVVYNGTNKENFDYSTIDLNSSREIGLHCGTEQACRDRGYKFVNKLILKSPNVLSLSFDMTSIWSSIELVRRMAQYDLFDEKQLESLENQMRKCAGDPDKYLKYSKLLREFFLNKGYNVISYPNEIEDSGSTSYIVLDTSIIQKDIGETLAESTSEMKLITRNNREGIMKLKKLNESNLTEDTVEKLYHSYKDIGKIVRFKGRRGNRWEIVDFIERYYNSYSEFKYKLKDIDMPGGTAVCDCDAVELVPTPKEQPKVEEPKKPKKDDSYLIRKYLTPYALADIRNVVDVSDPGNWHSDGAIVEFTYNDKTYYLDVQGGLTSERDKVWIREFRCKDTGEYYQDVSTYADNRGYKYGTLDLVKLITTGNWGTSNPRNTDGNRSSHLADSLDRTKLNEAIERGIKVYNVEVDGPPEVGRQIIAFVDSHEEYQIITRQDKDAINKKNWDNKDLHTSPDGEYYSGKNGWIYALDYTDYIYVDDLNLIPQRHHDKVAKEQQSASERKQQLTDTLIKLYGNDLGQKFADKYITVKKNGRSVDILGYASYLIEPATYCSALSSFFETIERDFGADIAKQTLLTSPTLKLPHSTTKYKVHLGRGKQLKWNSYLHLGFSIDVVGNYFIFTQLHSKADTKMLIEVLQRDGYLEKGVDYWSFTRDNVLKESTTTDLVERKKKKKGIHINKNAGNVEHNINMFNMANSPIDAPCNNPVSGPMGGDVCCESIEPMSQEEYEDTLKKMATDHYRGFDILHSTWHIKSGEGKEDIWDSYAFIWNGKMFPDEVYDGLDSLDKTKERIDQIIRENPKRFGELVYDREGADKWKDTFDVMSPQEVADTFNRDVKDGDNTYSPKKKYEGLDDDFDMFMRGI